ncbi:hypothetical protein EBZ39_02905 [bacterium]|nr:hypothetical protein [bacterium]
MIVLDKSPKLPWTRQIDAAEADLRFLCTMLYDLHESMPQIPLADVFAGSDLIPPIINAYRATQTEGGEA